MMSNQEIMFILDMVAAGTLTVPEAVELIELFTDDDSQPGLWGPEIEVSVRMNESRMH